MCVCVCALFQMEQIKRANKLFSNDCIFLRHSLNIPVHTERPSLFNGLSLESPDGEDSAPQESPHVSYMPSDSPSPPPPPQALPESTSRPLQPEELSAKDYLHMLDLQITRSKQAARKLKEDDTRWGAGTRAHFNPRRKPVGFVSHFSDAIIYNVFFLCIQ